MKILELCTSRGHGGLELYVLQVAEYLRQKDIEIYSVTEKGSMLDDAMGGAGIRSLSTTVSFRLFPVITAIRLSRYIEKNALDIIHVNWNKDLILAVVTKLFSKHTVKIVFTRHMEITRPKFDFYHRFIYQNIDYYLAITQTLYEQARRLLPVDSRKIEVLYHGVKPVEAVNLSCDKFYSAYGIKSDSFRILLPGRLEKYKGQHLLVEAIIRLNQSMKTPLQAIIIGHAMDIKYLEHLKEKVRSKNQENNIIFVDYMVNIQQYFQCFDAVVLTTYKETFGLVLVEAMMSGVAVIGTNAGGVPEIIRHGETGLMFEPGDVVGLAECILKLQDREDSTALADNGKKFAFETFSYDKHFSKLCEIFREIADKSRNEENA